MSKRMHVMINNMSVNTWSRGKAVASLRRITIRELVEELLEAEAKKILPKIETFKYPVIEPGKE